MHECGDGGVYAGSTATGNGSTVFRLSRFRECHASRKEDTMDHSDLKQWTADELVAELRRRERVAATKEAGGNHARAAQRPAPGRLQELQAIPTGELAKLVQR